MRIVCLRIVHLTLAVIFLNAMAISAPRVSWPEPKYQVRVEESVMIAMRDGIKLATDLYVPTGAGEKLPVILIRTPYDKAPYRDLKSAAHHFAGQGYVVAVQDT